MDYKMGSGQKLCATCEYWAGPRQLDFFASSVVLPNQSVNGKCACRNASWYRGDRLSNMTACFSYQKWACLK